MGEFPSLSSILVIDNTPVHHRGCIEALCDQAGVALVYLPPYPPNMNSIKKVFLVLKSRLKREQLLTGTHDDPDIIKEFLPELIDAEMMAALYQGSGSYMLLTPLITGLDYLLTQLFLLYFLFLVSLLI